MKLLINTSIIRFGGAVQVAFSFLKELKSYSEHEYHVFLGSGLNELLNVDEYPDNFYFYRFNFSAISPRNIPTLSKELSALEKQIKPDCVLTTSGPSYWNSIAPHVMGFNLPLHIYPESPYFKTIKFKKKIRLFLKRKFHFWYFRRDAFAYIVQTEDVNLRVRKSLGSKKVYTISNTHNGFYNNPKSYPNKLPDKKKNEIRLLTLTSYYPHKNIEIIGPIIREFMKRDKRNIRFILTITAEKYKLLFGEEFTEKIINIGPVKPEECPSLYKECDIMFLPTLAECFSASYPEAMAMKLPIITTDLSFAHDICHNAALYYEPMNPIDAANTIINLLNDKTAWNSLIKNGEERLLSFDTANSRARKILSVCEQVTIQR